MCAWEFLHIRALKGCLLAEGVSCVERTFQGLSHLGKVAGQLSDMMKGVYKNGQLYIGVNIFQEKVFLTEY